MSYSDTPATTRRDGWTEVRRVRFLDALAQRGNIRAACAAVGMSREAAYQLRRREPLFARAWAAALELGRAAGEQVLACRAIDGIEEEVWFRGEVVGTRIRYDSRLLLAHLARLDAAAAEGTAREDAERFDELLALVAGAAPPAELPVDDDGVPGDRDECVELAGAACEAESRCAEDAAGPLGDPAERRARDDRAVAAWRQARVQAGARWDGWVRGTHATVDRLLAAPLDRAPAKMPAWTLSGVSSSALAQAGAGGQPAASARGDRS